jgi:hypothetical protein
MRIRILKPMTLNPRNVSGFGTCLFSIQPGQTDLDPTETLIAVHLNMDGVPDRQTYFEGQLINKDGNAFFMWDQF